MIRTGFSYFGVRNPEHVRSDLLKMREDGCNTVLHTCSEDDESYYRGTMKEIISISKELGFTVYTNPWAIGRIFGGEANSEITARHPESRQILSDGSPAPAACPNSTALREYLDAWTEDVCATAVDTVFWDEPHFFFRKGAADLWACRCETCQRLFQERFGRALPSDRRDPELQRFRGDSLLELLGHVTEIVHRHGKRNCVCLLPDFFDAGTADWDAIATLPAVDEIATDPYWEEGDPSSRVEALYREYVPRAMAVAARHGRDCQVWIKNYRITEAEKGHVALATRIAREAGCRNIMAWSWHGSSYMSWLASEHPEDVYREQLTAFATAKGEE